MLTHTLTGLSDDDLEVLTEALEDSQDIANAVLDHHIDADMTPETLDEFLCVVATQIERVERIERLRERLEGLAT